MSVPFDPNDPYAGLNTPLVFPSSTDQPIPTLAEQANNAFWVDVKSSNVASVAYSEGRFDGVSWLWRTLFVTFHSGATYAYTDVSKDIYTALINAVSVGKYLNNYIKGTYSFVKVSDGR